MTDLRDKAMALLGAGTCTECGGVATQFFVPKITLVSKDGEIWKTFVVPGYIHAEVCAECAPKLEDRLRAEISTATMQCEERDRKRAKEKARQELERQAWKAERRRGNRRGATARSPHGAGLGRRR